MSDATFSDHLAWLSAVADIDLVTHGTTSDEATIKDTAVAQPLLVAAALATAWSVDPEIFSQADLLAGHSVGRLPLALLLGLSLPKPPWFLCASAVGPWPRPRHALPPP
ncbi:malonyl CoA-acyl carrier protein transacylase [Cutibacterium acnes JCM 18920]|nr:malonyl CoA-acyl carrier protein transacylase [Cutibacterium acnes JCM 18920]